MSRPPNFLGRHPWSKRLHLPPSLPHLAETDTSASYEWSPQVGALAPGVLLDAGVEGAVFEECTPSSIGDTASASPVSANLELGTPAPGRAAFGGTRVHGSGWRQGDEEDAC